MGGSMNRASVWFEIDSFYKTLYNNHRHNADITNPPSTTSVASSASQLHQLRLQIIAYKLIHGNRTTHIYDPSDRLWWSTHCAPKTASRFVFTMTSSAAVQPRESLKRSTGCYQTTSFTDWHSTLVTKVSDYRLQVDRLSLLDMYLVISKTIFRADIEPNS